MRNPIVPTVFVTILLLSSFLSTVNFNTYFFIHTETYILLAFCLGFIFVSVNFLLLNRGGSKFPIQINLTDLFILSLAGYVFIRYASSPSLRSLTDTILLYGILLIVYLYTKKAIRNSRESPAKTILYIIAGAGALQAIYGLLQLSDLLPNLFGYELGGSFGNPGDLANFLALTSTLILGLIFTEKRKSLRYLLIPFYVLHIVVIGISMARTAWIATLLANIYVLYHFKFKQSFNHLFIKKRRVVFILLLALLTGSPFLFYKLYIVKPSSAYGRLFIWELSLSAVKEKPLFGHGYESFTTVHRQAQIDYFRDNPEDSIKGWVADEPVFSFSDYLQLAVEYGIVGLIMLLIIVGRIVSLKHEAISGTGLYGLHISKAAILTILICMLFSYPLHNPSILICSVLLYAILSTFDKLSVFTVNLKRPYLYSITILLFISIGFLSFYSSRSVLYGLKWGKAHIMAQEEAAGYMEQYEKLYNVLWHDRSFLLNYGSVLYKSRNYLKCAEHFERYGYLVISTDMLLMQGVSYEKLGDYRKAEEHYQRAAWLVPHKFIPKYKLFKLYQSTGKGEEAEVMAHEIRNMKIKVYSEPVKAIKTEINEYLLSQKSRVD